MLFDELDGLARQVANQVDHLARLDVLVLDRFEGLLPIGAEAHFVGCPQHLLVAPGELAIREGDQLLRACRRSWRCAAIRCSASRPAGPTPESSSSLPSGPAARGVRRGRRCLHRRRPRRATAASAATAAAASAGATGFERSGNAGRGVQELGMRFDRLIGLLVFGVHPPDEFGIVEGVEVVPGAQGGAQLRQALRGAVEHGRFGFDGRRWNPWRRRYLLPGA